MGSYLERYKNGECEQVWNELIALGDAVRHEPLASDARAVAVETMQRARRNIETLYARLQSIGYQFECERERPTTNPLDMLRDQLDENPFMKSAFGDLLNGLEAFQNQLKAFGMGNQSEPPPPPRAYAPPTPEFVQELDTFERKIGPLPLSVRAWCEIVGTVDFMGDYPGLASYAREGEDTLDLRLMARQILAQNPAVMENLDETDEEKLEAYLADNPGNFPFPKEMRAGFFKLFREEMDAAKDMAENPAPQPTWWVSDPLSFFFEINAEEAQYMLEDEEDSSLEPGTFWIMVAPDIDHKANFSGSSYDIVLPDAKADTLLHGTDTHFVAYLRNSFAWGGFPGLEGQEGYNAEILAFLKDGLEPI